MYIKKLSIKNIRSIDHFEMEFEEPAGWHVIIGDNGSGKSSIVRAISMALIGPVEVQVLPLLLIDWIRKGASKSEISMKINIDKDVDGVHNYQNFGYPKSLSFTMFITKEKDGFVDLGKIGFSLNPNDESPVDSLWSGQNGWFSSGFGPFRRFKGGEAEWSK